jgi:hypothetical protein
MRLLLRRAGVDVDVDTVLYSFATAVMAEDATSSAIASAASFDEAAAGDVVVSTKETKTEETPSFR